MSDTERVLTDSFEVIRSKLPADDPHDHNLLLAAGSALLAARCQVRDGLTQVLAMRWKESAA